MSVTALPSTEQASILLVDDSLESLTALVAVLEDDYLIRAVTSGAEALIAVEQELPDLILLDVMMPGMSGFDLCRHLKADPAAAHIPIIFLTARDGVEDEIEGLEIGAADYLTRPVSPAIARARIRTHLTLASYTRHLEFVVEERTARIRRVQSRVIQRLGRAAGYKDSETGQHVVRMALFSREIALAAGLPEARAELICEAAPLHDVGKIGIPDAILRKEGPLDADEWTVMKGHCEIGAGIIGEDESELLEVARTIALEHHERWDGSGYPNGLAGEAISIEARIVAVADVFDALTTRRPYKEAWSVSDAVEALRAGAGAHFDPELVRLFVGRLSRIEEIRIAHQE